MISKEKLILALQDMPDHFSVDDLMERVIFLNKIEAGLRDIEEGKTYSTAEAKNMIKEWSK
jgi:predicted transcriptional regulator